jgi:hypothetical protein
MLLKMEKISQGKREIKVKHTKNTLTITGSIKTGWWYTHS